jgi:hypothetical protein
VVITSAVLSLKQRVFLIAFVFKNGDRYTESVKQEVSNRIPITREPHRDTFRDLVRNFRETGSGSSCSQICKTFHFISGKVR